MKLNKESMTILETSKTYYLLAQETTIVNCFRETSCEWRFAYTFWQFQLSAIWVMHLFIYLLWKQMMMTSSQDNHLLDSSTVSSIELNVET